MSRMNEIAYVCGLDVVETTTGRNGYPQNLKQAARLATQIVGIIEDLNEVLENEQSYFDERSEEWQCGEKGDEFQDRLYALEEFKDALDNAVYDINEVVGE